jgi:hypothetical protein
MTAILLNDGEIAAPDSGMCSPVFSGRNLPSKYEPGGQK